MSNRKTYSKYPSWKPSGSNDFTSTYLRRAELILNKDKKEEKKCSCGCSGGKDCKSSQKTVIFEEKPSDLILIPKQPKEVILLESNARPKPPARSKSCYYIDRPCRKPIAPPPPQRVIIETTIEHVAPQTTTVYTHRPATAYYNQPEYYTERVYYPPQNRGYYYCEPVEYVTNVYEY